MAPLVATREIGGPARESRGAIASALRLHIAAIAALGTLTFGWLFSGDRPWLLALVAGLDWFLVNLVNRAADLPEDLANGVACAGLASRRRRAILAASAALLALSFVATQALAPALLPLRLAYHALGLAYNWRVLPGRRRLKELYLAKNAASATGFLITVFAYPLAALGAPSTPGVSSITVAFAALYFFLFEHSYEVIYDLRDRAGDAAAGVPTYAVVHGERAAAAIVVALCAASGLVLVVGLAAGFVPVRLAIMASAPAIQVALFARAFRRGITHEDGVRLTWLGALLLATYHVWVALRLPGYAS